MKIEIGYSEKGNKHVEVVEIYESKNGTKQEKKHENIDFKKLQKEKTKEKKVK